jgi:hypothetical protein
MLRDGGAAGEEQVGQDDLERQMLTSLTQPLGMLDLARRSAAEGASRSGGCVVITA